MRTVKAPTSKMTDGYAGEEDEAFAKQIGRNFCAVLWAGVSEHDVPRLFYFFNACQNHVPAESPMREEMMLNLSKRLVGMADIASNLTGPQTRYALPTATFHSQQQVTAVRCVFPYHVVLSCVRPCSERALIDALNYATYFAFQNTDVDDPAAAPFVPHAKQALQPPPPSPRFEEAADLLDGFLVRFFEDETGREFVNCYHPLYLPKDILSPHLQALQVIKQLQKQHPISTACVLKNGRMLLSTAGPFMTNVAAMLAQQPAYNRRLHYVFRNYFPNEQPLQKFQNGDRNDNLQFRQYSVLHVTCFETAGMAAVLFSQQPTALKQNAFQLLLQQLNEKLTAQAQMPPVFAKLLDQVQPTFVPAPGCVDVCGVDAAQAFRGLRGVQSLQSVDGKTDYGVGAIDGGLLQYFHERQAFDAQVVCFQGDVDIGRTFEKQGEFYAFGENRYWQRCLLSGGIKQTPCIIAHYQADEDSYIQTLAVAPVGEADDHRALLRTMQELVETYIRVSWT